MTTNHHFRLAVRILIFALIPARAMATPPASRSFDYSRGLVWKAMLQSLTDGNIHPESAEATTCSIFFRTDSSWATSWGGVNNLVALITTKKVKGMSSWQGFVVSGTLSCNALTDSKTEVRAAFAFAGYNAWMGNWQSLASSGYLEEEIFDRIERTLESMNSGLKAGKSEFIAEARAVLDSLHRVDAAFKIGADSTLSARALIEAQARADEFSDSAAGAALPRFREAAGQALDLFKGHWKEPAAGKLESARAELGRAADFLNTYASLSTESGAREDVTTERTVPLQPGEKWAWAYIVVLRRGLVTVKSDDDPERSDIFVQDSALNVNFSRSLTIRANALADLEIAIDGHRIRAPGSVLRLTVAPPETAAK